MATPKEKFIEALKLLKELQEKKSVAIHTDEIPNRVYREILLKNGFIREVVEKMNKNLLSNIMKVSSLKQTDRKKADKQCLVSSSNKEVKLDTLCRCLFGNKRHNKLVHFNALY